MYNRSITSVFTIEHIVSKLKGYFMLLKFRLTFLVVFSGVMTYMLSVPQIDTSLLYNFVLGGFLVTGSANIINQIIEKDLDKLMKRTMSRPLPTGLLSVSESMIFAVIIGVLGIYIHWFYVNPLVAMLSFLSLLLYAFAYTPLKRVGPIAVFVGAIPGAMPPLIGWAAGAGEITHEALILFGIQFVWQFPHFWAIAWVSDEDYKNAGFRLLPSSGGKDLNTAFNIMIYTLFLIPISLLPLYFGITGTKSAIIVSLAGILFLIQTFYLMKRCDRKAALYMMFGSFVYLPIVQVAYVLDKL